MTKGKKIADSIKFIAGENDQSSDARFALMAACVVSQQRANFGDRADLRQVACPDCNAPGFNTGWGCYAFTCGAEWLTDGEPAEPCGRQKPFYGPPERRT